MGQVSAVLRNVSSGFSHWCPGCEEMHNIAVSAPNGSGARWTFDGNVDRPTFAPSVNISCVDPEGEFPPERCHYFLRGGMLQFLNDCTHKLAGQTVPLPPLPDGLTD